jgi:hypothetical protein
MKPTPPDVTFILESKAQTYVQTKAAINDKLNTQGYHIIEEKYHPEVFGSRYVTWSNRNNAIRLIWDGKDGGFYLQVLDTIPVDWRDNWKDLVYIPYDPKVHDIHYALAIPGKLIASLG